jgi:simple sugar transport system permease protein
MIFFAILNPKIFLTLDVYISLMVTIPFTGVISLGLLFIIICGEIDLSFPSVMGLSGFVFSTVFSLTGDVTSAFICCMLTGLTTGIINGILVAKVGVPSIIATLGTSFLWRGLEVLICGGYGTSLVATKKTILHNVLVGRLGDIPVQMLWFIAIAVLSWLIINRTKFGNHVLFTGDNISTARMMGVNVARVKLFVFAIMGVLAAFSGTLINLEMLYFWPMLGEGYLLKSLAAVFIGGTSIFGGEGTVFGTFVGCWIIGCLEAYIIMAGFSGFLTQFVCGLAIVIFVSIHATTKKR